MNSPIIERIAYGRQIQDEATRMMTAFGADALRAAEDWARSPGLTLNDQAFRNAVHARVARLLGIRDHFRAA
jgi:hypothetical protein